MSGIVLETWKSKDINRATEARYQSSVVHALHPCQKELVDMLKHLRETTSDFIDYTPIGRLGLVLANIDPVVKQLVTTDRRGNINDASRRGLEADINDELPHLRGATVQLNNSLRPLRAIEKGTEIDISLMLEANDPRLIGEKVLVERFMMRELTGVSERFGDELINWTPSITIGTVRQGVLDSEEMSDLKHDVGSFLEERMHRAHLYSEMNYGVEMQCRDLEFPEEITLSGLTIVCQKQPERIF